jgi:FAD/FMN-containing dehydrogenase
MAGELATEVMVDAEAIQGFVEGVRGKVLHSGDPGYDDARAIWNGLIDRRPALIVQCTGAADVVDAVNFAREQNLLLSVKGGAHVAGNAVNDGGLVIDLSQMNGVRVDPTTQTVRAQGGALWGDCDRETQLFGLAVPGGVVSTTGIAGLTLHGGVGHLRRKHGLSIDNLLSVDIVTADGQLRRASGTENEDLFWAVRGAGSNFGVVTSFEFQAHPVGPMVMVGAVFYPLEDGRTLLAAWRDYMAQAPEELSSLAFFWNVPAHEPFPPEHHGKPVLILAAVYSGSVEEGEPVVQPLRELAPPLIDLSGPWPWLGLQRASTPSSRRASSATGSRARLQSCRRRRSKRSPTGRPDGQLRSRTSRSGTTAA